MSYKLALGSIMAFTAACDAHPVGARAPLLSAQAASVTCTDPFSDNVVQLATPALAFDRCVLDLDGTSLADVADLRVSSSEGASVTLVTDDAGRRTVTLASEAWWRGFELLQAPLELRFEWTEGGEPRTTTWSLSPAGPDRVFVQPRAELRAEYIGWDDELRVLPRAADGRFVLPEEYDLVAGIDVVAAPGASIGGEAIAEYRVQLDTPSVVADQLLGSLPRIGSTDHAAVHLRASNGHVFRFTQPLANAVVGAAGFEEVRGILQLRLLGTRDWLDVPFDVLVMTRDLRAVLELDVTREASGRTQEARLRNATPHEIGWFQVRGVARCEATGALVVTAPVGMPPFEREGRRVLPPTPAEYTFAVTAADAVAACGGPAELVELRSYDSEDWETHRWAL